LAVAVGAGHVAAGIPRGDERIEAAGGVVVPGLVEGVDGIAVDMRGAADEVELAAAELVAVVARRDEGVLELALDAIEPGGIRPAERSRPS
jgi:imidazolonepropionase-like amidohydrolase